MAVADPAPGQSPAPLAPRRRGVVLVVVALAVAAGLLAAAARLPRPSAEVVGANLPFTAGATDALTLSAYNSPSAVAAPGNPARLSVVSRVDRPQFGCALHTSGDGGATWAEVVVPPPPHDDARAFECFAPDAAYGADGSLHVASTSVGAVEGQANPDGVWLRSARSATELGPPVRVAGPLAFQLRMAAHPTDPRRLYLAWLQATATTTWGFTDAGNPIVVARSDDGGQTWSASNTVQAPERRRVVAPSIAVGPGGEVYVAYLDVGNDRLDYHGAHEGRGGDPYPGDWSLVVARSLDGGATWSESVAAPRLVPTQRFIRLFPPVPSIAVDQRSGRVHVAFQDGRAGDADVWLWTSHDEGDTWRSTRVNDTPAGDGRTQFLPAVAVAPGGRVDVVYYDRRASADDDRNEVSLQSSFDGGRTFRPRVIVSDRSFDAAIGLGSDREMPEVGSRLGLLSDDDGALALWSDGREGSVLTGKQVLARAVVGISEGSSLVTPLQIAGGIALLVAVLVGGATWRGRRRRPDETGLEGGGQPAADPDAELVADKAEEEAGARRP